MTRIEKFNVLREAMALEAKAIEVEMEALEEENARLKEEIAELKGRSEETEEEDIVTMEDLLNMIFNTDFGGKR